MLSYGTKIWDTSAEFYNVIVLIIVDSVQNKTKQNKTLVNIGMVSALLPGGTKPSHLPI